MSTLICTHNAGATSCLTIRLENTIDFYERFGYYPDAIDSSQQFAWYQDTHYQNVSTYVFSKYWKRSLPYVQFTQDFQYYWYDNIFIDSLTETANAICPLSDNILVRTKRMINELEDRTAILYRGNDKVKEVARCEYQTILDMAEESKSKKFLVQTDEQDFYDFFIKHYPDTIAYDHIPRIPRSPNGYVMPAKGLRIHFLCNFLASLYSIGQAEKLILTTGNTGLWTMLFRGNTKNVWQFNGMHNQFKKL